MDKKKKVGRTDGEKEREGLETENVRMKIQYEE